MTMSDTKDWTWVLERACDECGFDSAAVDLPDVGAAIRANARAWQVVLAGPDPSRGRHGACTEGLLEVLRGRHSADPDRQHSLSDRDV